MRNNPLTVINDKNKAHCFLHLETQNIPGRSTLVTALATTVTSTEIILVLLQDPAQRKAILNVGNRNPANINRALPEDLRLKCSACLQENHLQENLNRQECKHLGEVSFVRGSTYD